MDLVYSVEAVEALRVLLEQTRMTRRYAEAFDVIEHKLREEGLSEQTHRSEGLHQVSHDIVTFSVVEEAGVTTVVSVSVSRI